MNAHGEHLRVKEPVQGLFLELRQRRSVTWPAPEGVPRGEMAPDELHFLFFLLLKQMPYHRKTMNINVIVLPSTSVALKASVWSIPSDTTTPHDSKWLIY